MLCDQNDPERAFVKFNKNDDTVLLIDNYGGLSPLELGALTHETLSQLGMSYFHSPKETCTNLQKKVNGISSLP
jgi:dihydroxyacetone kinase